ncbi:hypothetical protein [Hydrocarboniphaga sp.]|uniref:hypothetical protein n=1 Tax=Hydrocarboniphaga sp. TaxID=2033016 RepID=UPI0026344C46|nr:hypothetical protein [Hydrocarboniphaga sp.]
MAQNATRGGFDPFNEIPARLLRVRKQLLGGRFCFESESRALLKLVDMAYAGLPRHQLSTPPADFRIRLRLVPRESPMTADEPPMLKTQSGAGLLCGVMDAQNYAILYPDQRKALIVVSDDMLDRPYYPRYELIEFAVFTLAARAMGLVPLHGACIGRRGRGLLLLGASGAGKSTLALHGLLQGLEFLAEDAVFVEPHSLLATGTANFLHLRADSLQAFTSAATIAWAQQSAVIRRRSGVQKFELDLRGRNHRLAAAPLKLVAAIFVSSAQASDAQDLLQPLATAAVVERLTADQPYAATQPGWRSFVRQLSRMNLFELRRGQGPQAAVAALSGLLG